MKKLLKWVTNKHWEGLDNSPHYFCFREHRSGIRLHNNGTKEHYNAYEIRIFNILIYRKEWIT